MTDPAPAPYIRFPNVRGDLVTFVADDDIWLAPLTGGRAWRLTAERAWVSSPRLSLDGELVAWTSQLHGAPEVYVAPVGGGTARRLTYWGVTRTATRGWTPDGDVLAVSEAGQPSRERTWAYALPADGSPGRRLPYGIVDEVSYGPAGQVITATAPHPREPAWWKRYRGGTAAKLWLDRTGDGEFERLLPDHTASLVHPMFVGDRLLVVSDHEDSGRLYLLNEARTGLDELARHDFYVRHATTDGRTVVYVAAGELWSLDADAAVAGNAEPQRVVVELSGARQGRQPRMLAVGEQRGLVAVDKTGRASAVECRGTVHWVTHRDGPSRVLLAEPGIRARVPVVVADDRVALVTDADGEDAIEVLDLNDTGITPRRLAGGQLGRVLEVVAAPDGQTLAVAAHDGRLLLVDLAGDLENAGVRELTRSTEGEVADLAWSPDSAWLAWSHPGPDPLRQLLMARVADSKTAEVIEATPLRFTDTEPVFTVDGQHLAFLSVRSLDPVYDAYVLDLAFPGGCRPCLLPLAARTPSPFDPEVGGRPVQPDRDQAGKSGRHADADPVRPADEAESGDGKPPHTEVDATGLHARVVLFPVPAARYRHLQAVRGGVVWLRQPASGVLGDDLASLDEDRPRPTLERFELATQRCETLVDEVDDAWVSGDGARLVVADRETLEVLPADRRVPEGAEGDRDRVEVDLRRVRLHVDPVAEWRQMFDEAGRLMRDNYWRPDMGGTDWAGVLGRYRPLVERLGSHDDLIDLLWEVQGELGTSHAYVKPKLPNPDRTTRLGSLGADFARDDDGTWLVASVVPGESSDPRARSPLVAPGVDVHVGDALIAVDGRQVPSDDGPGPLLVGTAGPANGNHGTWQWGRGAPSGHPAVGGRADTALSRVGRRPPIVCARSLRRPARLLARTGHGEQRLGTSAPRSTFGDGSRGRGRRRTREQRRPHF